MWILELERARLLARVGTTAAERAVPQEVDLDVKIRFANRPAACETDALDDTVCYVRLVESAKALCDGREFQLIEFMAQQMMDTFRKELPADAELEVCVTKVRPPVEAVRGGVRFRLRG